MKNLFILLALLFSIALSAQRAPGISDKEWKELGIADSSFIYRRWRELQQTPRYSRVDSTIIISGTRDRRLFYPGTITLYNSADYRPIEQIYSPIKITGLEQYMVIRFNGIGVRIAKKVADIFFLKEDDAVNEEQLDRILEVNRIYFFNLLKSKK